MTSGEQRSGSDPLDDLLVRYPDLTAAFELINSGNEANRRAALEQQPQSADNLKLLPISRPEVEPLAVAGIRLANRVDQSRLLQEARQKAISLAVQDEGLTDIERLALLAGCRSERWPVENQFRLSHMHLTEINEALQPGLSVEIMGNQPGTEDQPDRFHLVGSQGGFRVEITDQGHRLRVTTSQETGLTIGPERNGCYPINHFDGPVSQPLYEFDPFETKNNLPTILQNDAPNRLQIWVGALPDEELFPAGIHMALATARAVAARLYGISRSLPPGFDYRHKSVMIEAVVSSLYDRIINRTIESSPNRSLFSMDDRYDNAIGVDLSQDNKSALVAVASLVNLKGGELTYRMLAKLEAQIANRQDESLGAYNLESRVYCLGQLQPFLKLLLAAA